ncbi:MAG: hypothetical protein KC466_07690, partial [Myxococcales bacterium]|nr:hypothetical protein [Myxococcales bacterium]
RDGARPDGALDRLRVEFAGLPIDLNAYYNVLMTLGVGGYRDQQLAEAGAVDYGDDHFTCFQFSYDWRRDNVENARRLHAFLLDRRAYVKAEIERRFGVRDAPVKFDLIAHSMGGLVARYLLRYGDADLPDEGPVPAPTWAGAQLVERAVLIGTPNAGSVKSLFQLVEGATFSSILPSYSPAVLGTMPAVYQLLPRDRHAPLVDGAGAPITGLLDPALWERMGWGLAAPDQADVLAELLPGVADPAERRRIALDHLPKSLARARRFQEALDQPSAPPPDTELFLVAGDAIETQAVAAADPTTGHLWDVGRTAGDGTVTRASALLDERPSGPWTGPLVSPIAWSQVTFLFSDHLGLTEDPAFTDNVLFLLLEDPRRRGAAGR